MAYIGTIPAEAYTSFAVQHFTTSATDTFTLDFPVANENEIALFINNVRQEPGSSYAYTASGTTLTLSSAITGSDSMYCVFIGKAVQTVTPASGSVTNDMLAGSIANAKLANSSITLNGSAVSLGGSATVGGENTPAFAAYMSAAQSISNDTSTKIAYDTEHFDTDSAYDSSTNYRFTVPSGQGGKYFIGASIRSGSVTDTKKINLKLFINGSEVIEHFAQVVSSTSGEQYTVGVFKVLDLSVADYVEVFVLHQSGSSVSFSSSSSIGSYFYGYKLIGV